MLFTPRNTDSSHASKNNNDSFFKTRVQTKLAVGQPGDKYEVEADKTADKVVSKINTPQQDQASITPFFAPKPVVQSKKESLQQKEDTGQEQEIQEKPLSESITPLVQTSLLEEPVQEKCDACEEKEAVPVQKKCKECEEKAAGSTTPIQQKCDACEKEEKLQAKNESGSKITETDLSSKLTQSKGGGAGMEASTQQEMSAGFGSDFSNVRIHTDSNAVQMNKELGSHAFTNGSDVYFNSGKYDPSSDSGKHLLAHELTHTVQQGAVTGVQTKLQENVIQREDDPCAEPQEQGSQAEANSASTAASNPNCAVANPSAEQPPEGQPEPEGEDTARDIEANEGGPVDERQSHAPPADANAPNDETGIQEGAEQSTEQALDPCALREQQHGAGSEAPGASVAGAGAASSLVPQQAFSTGQATPEQGSSEVSTQGNPQTGQQQEGDFLAQRAQRGISPLVQPQGLGEAASPELMEEREAKRMDAATAMASIEQTGQQLTQLSSGGVRYQLRNGAKQKEQISHADNSSKTSTFLNNGANHVNSIIANGVGLATDIRSNNELNKELLLADISIKRQSVSGFFSKAKQDAFTKAETAKNAILGKHAITLLQIEMSALMANMMVQQTHQTKTLALQQTYNTQLVALGISYTTGYNNLITAGTSKGQSAKNAATEKADEYRRAEGASAEIRQRVVNYEADGFWDGYLTYNRYMARADAAKEVGNQYSEGMVSQAKAQADKMMCGQAKDNEFMGAIFQKGNELLECALLNAQDAINRQKQAAIMQAQHTLQEMNSTIDNSHAATVAQLDEKEAVQLQLLNDYGIRQIMAIERDGEYSIAVALQGVNSAAGQLLQFLQNYKQTVQSSEAPDNNVFEISQQGVEGEFMQAVSKAEQAVTGALDAAVLSVTESGNQVLLALQQLYDQGIIDAQQLITEYGTSTDSLVTSANGIYDQISLNSTQAITGEQQNGINTINGVVTGVSGLITNIVTATASKFEEAKTTMETGMQHTIDTDLAAKICAEAEKAAADIQPWWKTALKVFLVILVIVVVALVIGPAVIGAVGAAASALAGSLGAGAALAGTIGAWAGPIIGGAIVGALSGAVIQVGNNLIDIAGTDRELSWESVTKGVVGAMVAGAIGGALGGLGGQFAQVLLGRIGPTAMSAGWRFVADLGINMAFDFVGGIVGDIGSCAVDEATCHPFSWESVLMGMAIGATVQVSMSGLSAMARPHGASPHVDAGVNPRATVDTPGTATPAPRSRFRSAVEDFATSVTKTQQRFTTAGQHAGNKVGFGANAPTVETTIGGINAANARIQDGEFLPFRNRPEPEAEIPRTNVEGEPPHSNPTDEASPETRPHPTTDPEMDAIPHGNGPKREGKQIFDERQTLYDSEGRPLPNNRPRRSGDPTFNEHGERIMTIAELKAYREHIAGWSQNGLEVKIVIDPTGRGIPNGAAAAFDYTTGTIYLRNKPTMLELFHESMHARHWIDSGGQAEYTNFGSLAREEYVFTQIMRNRKMFNDSEILRSQRVIYKYRNGHYPPKDWIPPSTPEFQSGIDWHLAVPPTRGVANPSGAPSPMPRDGMDAIPNDRADWTILSSNHSLNTMKTELENGTTPRAFESVLTLEEEAVLRFYTTNEGYKTFNQALRGGIPMTEFHQAQRNLLDRALEKLPISHYNEAPEMLYRIENMENTRIDEVYQVDGEITLSAFLSTTYSEDAMKQAMMNRMHSHIVRIRGKSGRLIETSSTLRSEMEILFRPGTRFRVVNKTAIEHPTNGIDPNNEVFHVGVNSMYGYTRVIELIEI